MAITKKSLKNLTPFKKGHKGNPKGRGKGNLNRKTILKILLDNMELPRPESINASFGETMNGHFLLYYKLLELGLSKGNVKAIELASKMLEGDITKEVNHTISAKEINQKMSEYIQEAEILNDKNYDKKQKPSGTNEVAKNRGRQGQSLAIQTQRNAEVIGKGLSKV